MNNRTSKSGISRWAVIVLLVLLFPVGLFLLIMKWSIDLDINSKIPAVVLSAGAVLTALMTIFFAGRSLFGTGDPFGRRISSSGPPFVLLIAGAWIFLVGLVVYTKNRSRRDWIRRIRDDDIRNLKDLGMLLHTGEEKAAARVEDLIERDYLEDMCIDYEKMCICKSDDPDGSVLWCADCGAANIIRDSRTHPCRVCGGQAVMRRKGDRIQDSRSVPLIKRIKSDKKRMYRYLANVLWVAAAFFSGSAAYFSFPVCILLFVPAAGMELLAKPRENPVILYSGIGSLTTGTYMTYIMSGMYLSKSLEQPAGFVFWNWYFCLMLFVIQFLIWLALARRAEILRVRPMIAGAERNPSPGKEEAEPVSKGGR